MDAEATAEVRRRNNTAHSQSMSLSSQSSKSTAIMATAGASAPPSLLEQVAMAGGAAVITVTFIHPIDVVKVSIGNRHVLF